MENCGKVVNIYYILMKWAIFGNVFFGSPRWILVATHMHPGNAQERSSYFGLLWTCADVEGAKCEALAD